MSCNNNCVRILNTACVCVCIIDEAQAPYSATVVISKVEYGTGYASSKKAAKGEAGIVGTSSLS